jgi:hypothetical protein
LEGTIMLVGALVPFHDTGLYRSGEKHLGDHLTAIRRYHDAVADIL